ncbi:hypothetical protein Droror1_Dr00014782 [Drosera rotundifolia]
MAAVTALRSVLRGVYDAGHRCFGENYVQEIVEKVNQVELVIIVWCSMMGWVGIVGAIGARVCDCETDMIDLGVLVMGIVGYSMVLYGRKIQ